MPEQITDVKGDLYLGVKWIKHIEMQLINGNMNYVNLVAAK